MKDIQSAGHLGHPEATHKQVQVLLPTAFPTTGSLDIAAFCENARFGGGDYYDFHKISDSRLAVIVADVSGSGSRAVAHASKMKSFFQSNVSRFSRPLDFALEANESVLTSFEKGTFVTMLIMMLDVATGEAALVRCGHCYPLVWRAANGKVEILKSSGLGLGISSAAGADMNQEYSFELKPSDCLLLYTDGVVESRASGTKEEFGMERLSKAFGEAASATSSGVISSIIADVRVFSTTPNDDMTLLALKRRGSLDRIV